MGGKSHIIPMFFGTSSRYSFGAPSRYPSGSAPRAEASFAQHPRSEAKGTCSRLPVRRDASPNIVVSALCHRTQWVSPWDEPSMRTIFFWVRFEERILRMELLSREITSDSFHIRSSGTSPLAKSKPPLVLPPLNPRDLGEVAGGRRGLTEPMVAKSPILRGFCDRPGTSSRGSVRAVSPYGILSRCFYRTSYLKGKYILLGGFIGFLHPFFSRNRFPKIRTDGIVESIHSSITNIPQISYNQTVKSSPRAQKVIHD